MMTLIYIVRQVLVLGGIIFVGMIFYCVLLLIDKILRYLFGPNL